MSNHTPTPWYAADFLVSAPGTAVADCSESANTTDVDHANAARIVACVNACVGIDDPAAVLAEVRAALADHLDMLDEGPGYRTRYGHARTAALLALLGGTAPVDDTTPGWLRGV